MDTDKNNNNVAPCGTFDFKFIDLFAGIGGFRIALESLGGECVFSSEIDEKAAHTYESNFGDRPSGDITKHEVKGLIPSNFDVLCGGFPCQSFSIAGRRGGFEDARGTLFFDVAEIIKKNQPKIILLENVKGLVCHDKGKTLKLILNILRNDLGYYVPEPKVLNARDFGLPQNRERIIIVGFHPSTGVKDFEYPVPIPLTKTFLDMRESDVVPTKYYLSTQYLKTLINHKERHASKGNGFGYAIIPDHGVANTLLVGGMGRERNLVIDNRITDFTPTTRIVGEVNRNGIRKMTPREWANLQGYPKDFKIVCSDAAAYKQFGNTVPIPVIRSVMLKILERLNR